MSWWNVPLTPEEEKASGSFPRKRVLVHSDKRAVRFNEHHDETGKFTTGAEQVTQVSAAVAGNAALAEPRVSSDMKVMAQAAGGKLQGFEFRLKTEDSLARKIQDKVDLGMKPDEAGASVKDALRYTVELPDDDHLYTKGIEASSEELRAKGYTENEMKNYWEPGDAYQGINSVWTSPEGQRFELQYHTEASFESKMSPETLEAYHTMRDTDASADARTQAYDFMVENAAQIPIPPDALTIGTPILLPGVHT